MQKAIQAWLDAQCSALQGVSDAVIMLVPRGGQVRLAAAATWPRGVKADEELQAAASAAFDSQVPSVKPVARAGRRRRNVVAHPVQVGGRTVGAVAIAMRAQAASSTQSVLTGVERGAVDFENFLRQWRIANAPPPAGDAFFKTGAFTAAGLAAGTPDGGSGPAAALAQRPPAVADDAISPGQGVNAAKATDVGTPGHARILHLLATIEAHEAFAAAAGAFATELAAMFHCERVSVGMSNGRHLRVEGLSSSAEFKSSQGLLRDIAAAMEEAVWQGATMIFPQPEGAQPRVDRLHAVLAQRHGAQAIYTILLVQSGRSIGAVCLERTHGEALARTELTLLENIGALLGPLLHHKRAVSRAWPMKIVCALREGMAPLTGPGHRLAKFVTVGVCAGMLAAAIVPADYRVRAPARLEGATQRVLVAPVDGYLKHSLVRPGDRVRAGQLLAEMADEDLRLELRKAQSEVAQSENAYGAALTRNDRAEIGMLQARLQEARAQLDLIQVQLERVSLTAPFDGVVITGDLSQSLGAPVKKGEPLLTLAPERDFRVILEVDERDIGDLGIGQPGHLALAALPDEELMLAVYRITPVATAGEGRNYFDVEARLKGARDGLRPGLQGIGKVDAGQRPLLWIWSHRVVGWARLRLWSWIG